jgi:hypothetical protein
MPNAGDCGSGASQVIGQIGCQWIAHVLPSFTNPAKTYLEAGPVGKFFERFLMM